MAIMDEQVQLRQDANQGALPDAGQDAQEPVSALIANWTRERPDLDFEPMHFFATLARAYFLVSDRIDGLAEANGLTRGMFDVLATLRRSGAPYSLTHKQLTASLLLSAGGMTNRLDRLEESKLVLRLPDQNDRRSLQIKLTRRGFNLVDRMIPDVLDAQRSAFVVGGSNVRELVRLLGILNERMVSRGEIRPVSKRGAEGR
ncbi:MAG: MarR family transcriptional regulator [Methylobacteriaceae bacterium]|nr:MarR family transcriptional regulator [Methylobacteriaceae bacterium]